MDKKNQLDEAIACYRNAIELDLRYAGAHLNLGAAVEKKGQLDEAIACYNKAIELDPKYSPAHTDLGIALAAKGQLDEAIACYRKAIELQPDVASVHSNLGEALRGKGQVDDAIVEYKKAIEIEPKLALAHNNLGIGLLEKGDVDEAIECFKKAIALDPKITAPRTNLAVAQRWADGRDKFPGYMDGSYVPATSSEQLVLAEWCHVKKFHHTSTRLYSEAFAADPKMVDDLQSGHRYNAAFHATLAAVGQGEDAANLDEQEQVRLRKQALDWLRADLAAYAKQLEAASNPPVRTFVFQRVAHWQQDGDLASIRDEAALAALQVDEREAFTQLWADVAALLKKTSKATELDKP